MGIVMGCSSSSNTGVDAGTPAGDAGADANRGTDAGTPSVDANTGADARIPPGDAATDAGTPTDAGPPSDAGTDAGPGDAGTDSGPRMGCAFYDVTSCDPSVRIADFCGAGGTVRQLRRCDMTLFTPDTTYLAYTLCECSCGCATATAWAQVECCY